MVNSVFDIISLAFNSVFGWFQDLFDALDMLEVFLGAFLIVTSSRFLLLPLLAGGFGGSDKAGSSKSDKAKSSKSKKSK